METPINNVKTVSLDRMSYVAIPLSILSETGQCVAQCTGFTYWRNERYYLITNWHCFTGKHPDTSKPLNRDGFVLPSKVELPLQATKEPKISWKRMTFELIDDATNPKWFVHPRLKNGIDVVALDIGNPEGIFMHPINQQDFEDFNLLVADDVYILGFPYGVKGGGNFPIWKRASIATEPDIDYDHKPQILVDTASREGMSGSPVIFRRDGIHGLVDTMLSDDSIIGEIQNFVGIYSGRYKGETELDAQLGIVWKKSVIDEIIDGKIVDSRY
jgi:hypothetical protein